MSQAPSLPPLAIPYCESPLLWNTLPSLPPRQRQMVQQFADDGYVIIDLGLPDLDKVCDEIISTLGPRYPANDRRIEEAWYFCPAVRQVACAPAVLEVLQLLYGRKPFPFQTLNFDKGTSQPAHSDTIHFHCAPRHFMAGVWAAFEDMDENNGTLMVFPKSHKLPDYTMAELGLAASNTEYGKYEQRVAEILKAEGFERHAMRVRKGQAVIWAANLFHGGMPIVDHKRSRHSQASHYYFDDSLFYFPMHSEPHANRMIYREAIDILSGRMVTPRIAGAEFDVYAQPFVWKYPRPLPPWAQESEAKVMAGAAG